ncbi:MAG: hypothetical protein ACI4NA_00580 [Succinivibrio sp.]
MAAASCAAAPASPASPSGAIAIVKPEADARALVRQLNALFFRISAIKGDADRPPLASLFSGSGGPVLTAGLVASLAAGGGIPAQLSLGERLDAVARRISMEIAGSIAVINAANRMIASMGIAKVSFSGLATPRFAKKDGIALKDLRAQMDRLDAFADDALSAIDEMIDDLEGL